MANLRRGLAVLLTLPFVFFSAPNAATQPADAQSARPLAEPMSYRRLLPLDGGSNFRDIGGYPVTDGRRVKRGLLFRSGAMTGLTEEDRSYLAQFGFAAVVDLRSSEEIELYPNHWAAQADLNYISVPYSIMELTDQNSEDTQQKQVPRDYSTTYPLIAEMIKPQLKAYFKALVEKQAPIVVNCSAGQDRTGIAAALVLTALGVDESLIMEDYLLSTDFRRPKLESGDVNLQEAAKTNAFARMMLDYAKEQDQSKANPLITIDGTPFLKFALEAIRSEHGSIEAFLIAELGVSIADLKRLKEFYLTS
ncbi:MAG: tyrosine-protein phosphatase [Pseudomonadota bacterium]|nr:tyrosine-protein phosphatase [Pseudomonadota bacterium]